VRDTAGRAADAGGDPVRKGSGPRVYLHIGEPKTGTTYLQHNMWVNRPLLASQGVLLPGYGQRDHYRASRDLRNAPREPSDPEPSWKGDWDVLIRQALHAPKAALISDEILAACNPPQVSRAVTSLLPSAEVHVILTVRAFATLLPAEWQETIKCRRTQPWDEWLGAVAEATPHADRRRRAWFWAVHDTLAILTMWSQHLPPDHLHVVILPPAGPPGLLWERFTSVLGIDGSAANLSKAPANSSIGQAEAEFLRRLNMALPPDLPDWFYKQSVKRMLTPEVLSARPRESWGWAATREAWVAEQSEVLVAGLRDSKYHIVGDPDELAYRPVAGHSARAFDPPPEQMLDAGVDAAAALTHRLYLARRQQPAPAAARRRRTSPRKAVSRLKWAALNGPRLRQALYNASEQHAAARRLRVAIWCVLVRPGRVRSR
jgi:hypothetical protein